jgi:Uma2 family endonuclease
MAKPADKMSWAERRDPDLAPLNDEEEGVVTLQRVVERPDGRLELVEMPLTRELYLNPRLEDKMTRGQVHGDVLVELKELLGRHFKPHPEVTVLMDVKHLLKPRKGPSPDISIIRGMRDPHRKRQSFSLAKEGVIPSLVIEIISPVDPRVRKWDEVDKYKLYEQVGIPEYILVEPPQPKNGHRFLLKGHRLDPQGGYQPIVPDAQGRLRSETMELLFGVSAEGDRLEVFDAKTGERLFYPVELEERADREGAARRSAEKRAARAEEARRAAELKAVREAAARQAEETARKEAELRATQEGTTRQAAEERAAYEETARKAAEEELELLRAQLKRLTEPPDASKRRRS